MLFRSGPGESALATALQPWEHQLFLEDWADARSRLGDTATKRIESEGLHRTVCDYIAGMTDRYLLEAHARLQGASTIR